MPILDGVGCAWNPLRGIIRESGPQCGLLLGGVNRSNQTTEEE